MSPQGWHDFFLVGGALLLVAVCSVIDPPSVGGPLRVRLAMNLAIAAFIISVILLANLI